MNCAPRSWQFLSPFSPLGVPGTPWCNPSPATACCLTLKTNPSIATITQDSLSPSGVKRMPQFSYEAVEPSGRVVKGSLEAESASTVLSKLQSLNYTVVDVVQSRAAMKMPAFGKK